ncbi:MAG: chromosome segregation protein SMC [Xanthomonadales bacterium]|jgi:chromosome segregation protein|nr:chromosome segregation protein SMC [Xanthomonadales bacterium]
MRLTEIKLAGFKSFVDPTTFKAPTNLTGIVGPNGCGKSNIIDAVRWVMGEGSARVLRGELMSDVIFSGSSSRKPVGTATVELVFDNSDGKVGGEFADYNEISVKRQVSRDGTSKYFLNGTACRRKDIRDLFLGTGVGAHGYSIIEQGMISRVVDAKPEQIRGYLEEAAGISRYKERRRETENRIRHTRDNLARLSDLREEVEKHIERLKRQARAAERYRELKQQQRDLESRLLALRWRHDRTRAEAGKEDLAQRETALEEQTALQRAAEAELEKIHEAQEEAGEARNIVQGEVYEIGSEIARLEQKIEHNRELQQRQQNELDETTKSLQDLEQHMLLDKAQVSELTGRLAESEPKLEAAQAEEEKTEQALKAAEAAVAEWQEQMNSHHGEFNALNREAEALRSALNVLDQRMATASERLEKLKGESTDVGTQELLAEMERLEQEVHRAAQREQEAQDQLDKARAAQRSEAEALQEGMEQEHALQREVLSLEGRLEALQALQKASQESGEVQDWLKSRDLADHPLLVNRIEVEAGWEGAAEAVLGHWLEARVVDGMANNTKALANLADSQLRLVHERGGTVRARTGTLAEKVKAPDAITVLLNHVRVVDDLDAALEFLELPGEEESAVTRAGEWVGPGWARVARGESGQAGMVAREQEIQKLRGEIDDAGVRLRKQQDANERLRLKRGDHETTIAGFQSQVNEAHREHAQLESRLGGARQRIEDLDRRGRQIAEETETLKARQVEDTGAAKKARGELDGLLERMAGAEDRRSALDAQRAELLERRDAARQAANEARSRRYDLAMNTSSARASLDSLKQSLARMDTQVGQLQTRFVTLQEDVSKAGDPAAEFKDEMDALLEKQVAGQERLNEARARVQALQESYRERDAERQAAVQKHEALRGELERARLKQQEIELSARGFERQAEQLGADLAVLAEGIPDDARPEQWEADIERLGVRITRLEPVNLAAINEYEEESKRKEYLDSQYEDLTQALATLEGAIAKIDRKTRTRFKDTFEMVNTGMKELFPRLFGGGHGYLELTGEDLLTTGVAIMARPPGKRVSSIHLLSGGEKALTAASFVFSIFRLNPAPFCLLDEVDAPLDDANVGRFCDLVKEMADDVQFIVVTHNKITMEMAHQLSGVTMREPGVSRLVQVDLDEAARLAEA